MLVGIVMIAGNAIVTIKGVLKSLKLGGKANLTDDHVLDEDLLAFKIRKHNPLLADELAKKRNSMKLKLRAKLSIKNLQASK